MRKTSSSTCIYRGYHNWLPTFLNSCSTSTTPPPPPKNTTRKPEASPIFLFQPRGLSVIARYSGVLQPSLPRLRSSDDRSDRRVFRAANVARRRSLEARGGRRAGQRRRRPRRQRRRAGRGPRPRALAVVRLVEALRLLLGRGAQRARDPIEKPRERRRREERVRRDGRDGEQLHFELSEAVGGEARGQKAGPVARDALGREQAGEYEPERAHRAVHREAVECVVDAERALEREREPCTRRSEEPDDERAARRDVPGIIAQSQRRSGRIMRNRSGRRGDQGGEEGCRREPLRH